MTSAVLDAHVLDKSFAGPQPVLRDVRLRLRAGELVALVGASGCGKSTLLRVLAGLDRDFQGTIRLDGRPQDGPSREIGVAFQEPRLFPWLRVDDNIAFAAGGARPGDARVAALLAEVGLAAHARALPRQLSGGQAQRAALARALYTEPRVLLLDEPFSALDPFTRKHLQGLLRGLVRRHGVAALLVTHDVDEAAALADRVIVLEAHPGRVRDEFEVGAEGASAARERMLSALHAVHAL